MNGTSLLVSVSVVRENRKEKASAASESSINSLLKGGGADC